MKTLVMTNREIDPLWQDWSKAAAYAETLPVGSDEEQAAWRRADELWERFRDARYRVQVAETHQCRCALEEADYDATVDAASYRSQ